MKSRTLPAVAVLLILAYLAGCATSAPQTLLERDADTPAEAEDMPSVPAQEAVEPEAVEESDEAVQEDEPEPVQEIQPAETDQEPAGEPDLEEKPREEAEAEPELVPAPEEDPAKEITLAVAVTSDIRGRLLPYDFIEGEETDASLAQIYSYLNRSSYPKERLILLDTGNMLQGQPLVYYYSNIKTDSEHIAAGAMNAMGYAAAVAGVRDLVTGPGVYEKVRRESGFPWLAANAVDSQTGEPYFDPYIIVERAGIKTAVLGLVDRASAAWLPDDVLDGFSFTDPEESAALWLERIRQEHDPDIIIGLYQADESIGPDVVTARELVRSAAGFDLLFYGNSGRAVLQTAVDPEGRQVWIAGGEAGSRSAAVAEITFIRESPEQRYAAVNVETEIVQTAAYAADPEVLALYEEAKAEVESYVSQPIGTLDAPLDAQETLWGDSAYMDFIHQLQLDLTGADIALGAPASALAGADAGAVQVRDMFRIFPDEYQLYAVEMTGREIDAYLEYSYGLWFSRLEGLEEEHLLRYLDETEGQVALEQIPVHLYDSASGITYQADLGKEPGDRITITGVGSRNRAFDPDRTYLAAVTSFRGSGGGGHMTEGAGIPVEELHDRILFATLQDMRLYAIRLFSYMGNWSPTVDGSWKLVPEKPAQAAEAYDRTMIIQGQ
jgi:2',3'-cyclic-nucleotide 2'-phosphodiesterase / 3'-nucleotidase